MRKQPLSSPKSPEPKHVTLRHQCAMPLPLSSCPDGQLSSHTPHSRHLQPPLLFRIHPTIRISMASPHLSVTSSHNSHQTPRTQPPPPTSSLIRQWTLCLDLAFGFCTSGHWPVSKQSQRLETDQINSSIIRSILHH